MTMNVVHQQRSGGSAALPHASSAAEAIAQTRHAVQRDNEADHNSKIYADSTAPQW